MNMTPNTVKNAVAKLVICDVNYGFPFWLSLDIALIAGFAAQDKLVRGLSLGAIK